MSKNYMTWREIYPILLKAMTDGLDHNRRDLKKLPEMTGGYDHGHCHYENDSMTSYRAGWTLTLLRRAEFVENPAKGIWRLSSRGKRMKPAEIKVVLEEVSKEMLNAAVKKRKKILMETKDLNREAASKEMSSETFSNRTLEDIRNLLSLSRSGLITMETAMGGIEKAVRC